MMVAEEKEEGEWGPSKMAPLPLQSTAPPSYYALPPSRKILLEERELSHGTRRRFPMTKALLALAAITAAAVLVSYMGNYRRHDSHIGTHRSNDRHDPTSIKNQVLGNFDPDNIKKTLRSVTTRPHVAGTPENYAVADKIAQLWREIGLENVHFLPYDVLLSYPNYTQPNTVALIDGGTGQKLWSSTGVSPVIIPDEQGAPGAGVQWLAYSAASPPNMAGEPVYCHYGTVDDFAKLREMGISLDGRIAVMRYNTDFRGDKVYNAQQAGAIGAILYSDPAECAREGTGPANVYPSTVWMPPHGVQRGSIMHGLYNGDLLSPFFAARRDILDRRTLEEARDRGLLPKIPVVPMSYADAYEILSRISGTEAPSGWQGGLNFTYHIGPGLSGNSSLAMHVNSIIETREIRDVVGYIRGAEEPDEWVMLGNHYDAWVYGSIDPNSGTAVLAEVASAIRRTMNETGWRPRRSIVFCNWDAEEHALIGSTEFVEEFASQLHDRAVAYFNLDLLSNNQTLDARTVPTLYQAVVDAAKQVKSPVNDRETVYDSWVRHFPPDVSWLPTYPKMNIPGGGSDHAPFLNYIGMPVVDFTYRNSSWDSYPLYHSLYETPFVNEHLFDTEELAVHKATGQFWAQLALSFTEPDVYPLNVSTLARRLREDYVADLKRAMDPLVRNGAEELQPAREQLSSLIKKCAEFITASRDFEQTQITGPPTQRTMAPQQVNRRLKAVDRCFINPRGITPGVPIKRHMLFSLSDKDSYQPTVMAGVYDQLDNFKQAGSQQKRVEYGRKVAQEIAAVQLGVQCAINEMQLFV